MLHRPSWLTAVLCILPLFALPQAFAALEFTETWSDANDVEGWISLNPFLTLSHDNANNTLAFTAANGFDDAGPVAGTTSSGGAFVGNISAMGGAYYAFDILIDSGSDLDNLGLGLSNLTGSERWLWTVPSLPTFGQWTHYEIPVIESNFTHVLGSQSFTYLKQNLRGVAVGLSEPSTTNGLGVTGQLDNFRLGVPEPGTGLLMGLGLAGLAARRRRRG